MSDGDEGSIFDALADRDSGIDNGTYPYYDRAGKRIGRTEFMLLFEQRDYRIVKQETVNRPFLVWLKGLISGVWFRSVWISTVWLGIDHNFFGEGAPVIFETMVFGGVGHNDEVYSERYTSEAEAIAKHEQLVRYFKQYGRVVPVEAS